MKRIEGLIAILAQPRSWSPRVSWRVTITARILATLVKYFEESVQCKVKNWMRYFLLSQLVRYHRNNNINGFEKGFLTFRRKHLFSVAMCIMRMRAWWLTRVLCSYNLEPRVFFWFLWRKRGQILKIGSLLVPSSLKNASLSHYLKKANLNHEEF